MSDISEPMSKIVNVSVKPQSWYHFLPLFTQSVDSRGVAVAIQHLIKPTVIRYNEVSWWMLDNNFKEGVDFIFSSIASSYIDKNTAGTLNMPHAIHFYNKEAEVLFKLTFETVLAQGDFQYFNTYRIEVK